MKQTAGATALALGVLIGMGIGAARCSDRQVLHPTTPVGRSRPRVARLIDGGVSMIQFQELVRLSVERSS